MRSEVVRVRRSDYVEAAFGSGGSFPKVLWRHVLPNSLTSVIAFAALQFGNAILSRWPLSDDHKVVLPHLARLGGTERAAVGATVLIGERRVRVYSVHLATLIANGPNDRRDQLRTLLADADSQATVIIGGDFTAMLSGYHDKIFAPQTIVGTANAANGGNGGAPIGAVHSGDFVTAVPRGGGSVFGGDPKHLAGTVKAHAAKGRSLVNHHAVAIKLRGAHHASKIKLGKHTPKGPLQG